MRARQGFTLLELLVVLAFLAVLIGLLLAAAGAWQGEQKASPEALTATALAAKEAKERKRAAVELTMIKDQARSLRGLRRVATETKDPEVLVVVLHGLSAHSDTESLPLFFFCLNHPEKIVRVAALEDVLRIYGGSLPEDLEYDADAPPAECAKVARRLQEIYQKARKTPPPASKGGPSPK